MFKERTDLALELHEINIESEIDDGVSVNEINCSGVIVSRIDILNKNGEKKIGKEKGIYITIDIGDFWNKDNYFVDKCIDVFSKELKGILDEKYKSFLIVGLGNRNLVCDSIGPDIVDKIIVTHHIKSINKKIFDELDFCDVSAIVPGVMADTGIESAQIINKIVPIVSPDAVIVIDALASRNIKRLCTTIQLSNTGISPGSGVKNNRQEISMNTVGVPVFSIGVPTVVDASTLVYNVLSSNDDEKKNIIVEEYFKKENNFFVSLKESDFLIEKLSKIIAKSLNISLHRNISPSKLDEFII